MVLTQLISGLDSVLFGESWSGYSSHKAIRRASCGVRIFMPAPAELATSQSAYSKSLFISISIQPVSPLMRLDKPDGDKSRAAARVSCFPALLSAICSKPLKVIFFPIASLLRYKKTTSTEGGYGL